MGKYVVACSVEKTFEAKTANLAVQYFLNWLTTDEGSDSIMAIEKEHAFRPKRG